MPERSLACPLLFAILAAGCAAAAGPPDLKGLYSRSARHHDANRNPVIVIPGILGSNLRDTGTGRVVWGALARDPAFTDNVLYLLLEDPRSPRPGR